MLLVQRGSDKPMSDRICIEGLTVDGLIGVYPHELDRPQRLVVDLCAETDTRSAAHSERLVDTLDYDRLAECARTIIAARHHNLIETVAERIAALILHQHHGRVRSVTVRVCKPGAVADARTVAVEITREFDEFVGLVTDLSTV